VPERTRVFISHAAADKDLAAAFVTLLKEIGVRGADIFCTSLAGHKVPAGKDFKLYIRDQLRESDLVVALISKSYLDSSFCLCEVGAVWILTHEHFFPYVVHPATFSDFDGALHGTQGLKIDEASDLSELRDALRERLGDQACNTPMWDSSRDDFLKKLLQIIAKLPDVERVKKVEFDRVSKELAEYKDAYNTLQGKYKNLGAEFEQVKLLKDAAAWREISSQYKSEEENLIAAIETASSFVSDFPRVIREALFHWARGDYFVPDWQQWGSDPESEEQRGRLTSSGNAYYVNTNDPDIEDAVSALSELRDIVDSASDDLKKGYRGKYRENLDFRLRPFWERWLTL
jgi:hypothetical protein